MKFKQLKQLETSKYDPKNDFISLISNGKMSKHSFLKTVRGHYYGIGTVICFIILFLYVTIMNVMNMANCYCKANKMMEQILRITMHNSETVKPRINCLCHHSNYLNLKIYLMASILFKLNAVCFTHCSLHQVVMSIPVDLTVC